MWFQVYGKVAGILSPVLFTLFIIQPDYYEIERLWFWM